jgi:RimJ/RimL family protein N-acetyltransferase
MHGGFVTPIPTVSVLGRMQKPDIRRHLSGLSTHDLWLRFGSHVSESALDNYVNRIDFASDIAVGIHHGESKLVGFIHVAVDRAKRCAELGISVSPDFRRRGYAGTMLREALHVAADVGVDRVYVYFRTSNLPMMRLARKAGFAIATDGGEAIATKQMGRTPPQKERTTAAALPLEPCLT